MCSKTLIVRWLNFYTSTLDLLVMFRYHEKWKFINNIWVGRFYFARVWNMTRSYSMFWFLLEQIHRFSFDAVDRFFDLNEQIHQNLAYDLKKLRFKRTRMWVGLSLSLRKRSKLKWCNLTFKTNLYPRSFLHYFFPQLKILLCKNFVDFCISSQFQ